MGVLLLVASPVTWLAGFIGLLLHYTISLLNGIVFFVEALPFSLINGVNITAAQCVLLMGLIIFAIRLFESRKFHHAVGGFVLLTVFTCIQWWNLLADKDHDQLIVYHVPGHGALEWIKASQSYFYSDSVLIADEDQLRYHIRPSRLLSGVTDSRSIVSDPRFLKSFIGFRFFLLGKTTVLWIDQRHHDLPQNSTADYLIIGNDAVPSLNQLQNKVRFRKLILDSSNSRNYAARLVKEAGSKNITVHSVVSEGAFVVNM
jgi:competence protein ComEC